MSDPSVPGLGPGYRLTVEDAPADADVDVLAYGLEAYNEGRWPQHPPWQPLTIFLRNGAQIVAGLAGETYCGWLFVKYLWVSDGLHGRGVGRELMTRAEVLARERGCHCPPGHVQLSGARLLRKARLSGVRASRLSARPLQAFHTQAVDPAGIAVGKLMP